MKITLQNFKDYEEFMEELKHQAKLYNDITQELSDCVFDEFIENSEIDIEDGRVWINGSVKLACGCCYDNECLIIPFDFILADNKEIWAEEWRRKQKIIEEIEDKKRKEREENKMIAIKKSELEELKRLKEKYDN